MRKFPLLVGAIVLAVIVAAVLLVMFAAEPEGNCRNPETQSECDRAITEAAGVLAKKRGRSACIPKAPVKKSYERSSGIGWSKIPATRGAISSW